MVLLVFFFGLIFKRERKTGKFYKYFINIFLVCFDVYIIVFFFILLGGFGGWGWGWGCNGVENLWLERFRFKFFSGGCDIF